MSIDNSVWVIRERAENLFQKRIRKTVTPKLGLSINVMDYQVSINHLATHPSIDNMRILRVTGYKRGASRQENCQEFMVAVEKEILWDLPFARAVVVFEPTMEDETVVTIYTMPKSNW